MQSIKADRYNWQGAFSLGYLSRFLEKYFWSKKMLCVNFWWPASERMVMC
jgi:hypothetical protein